MSALVCESVTTPNLNVCSGFSLNVTVMFSLAFLPPSPSPRPALLCAINRLESERSCGTERTVTRRHHRTHHVSSHPPAAAARLPGFASLRGGKGEKQRLPKGS